MEPSNDENHLSLFKRKTRIFSLVAMFFIIAAIPFTVYVAQQRQDIRQRAALDGSNWGGNSIYPTSTTGQGCNLFFPCPEDSECVSGHCVSESTPTLSPTPACSSSCPQFTPPHPDWCKDGKIIPGGTDRCGCQLSPTCERLTPSITPSPSLSITPTPTIISSKTTQLAFELVLSGLGPNGGNQNPKKPKRELRVQVFDVNNKEAANKSGEITFDPQSQTFKGTVDLGPLSAVLGEGDSDHGDGNQRGRWPSPTSRHSPSPTQTPFITPTSPPPGGRNTFVLKVKTKRYLRKIISGVTTLNLGTLNTMPLTTLIIGDINDDNKLTIEDYNILIGCFASKANTSSCTDKENADLDDDDSVGGVDLNLFLRSLAVQEGD